MVLKVGIEKAVAEVIKKSKKLQNR